jgi:CRISPR-associated protein Csx17
MSEIRLDGCTPEPLMNYLKALGVFRLVAEQADAEARLSWRGGAAVLHTAVDRQGMVSFFLKRYQPTPILAPWNGGSGFFDGEDPDSSLGLIRSSESARLASYRSAIACSDQVVTSLINVRRIWKECEARRKELGKQQKPIPDKLKEEIAAAKKEHDTKKNRLQVDLRQVWPDHLLDWFDTVAVFHEDGEGSYQALLGSGGNDGRLDFSNNFMQRLADVIPLADGDPPDGSAEYLSAALFADALVSLGKSAVGQFNPGGIGGPNGTQGRFEAGSRVNPWDFVLMIEGAMLFAGSVARRLGTAASSRAVFPFTVESVAVGYGSATASEETTDSSRAELWLPQWDRPATFAEVKHLFGEGRAQLGRRQARNAVEFAVAVNLLGVSRGVKSFVRYGFLKRNGLAFLATPLGRIEVKLRPNARLLDDPPLVGWMDKLRSACRDKDKTPARYQTALRQIDRTMFGFANRSEQGNDAKYLLDVLAALGSAERTLAGGLSFCKEKYLRPLQGLSSQWLDQADDVSPEFRLAVALGGIRADKEVGPLRAFLEEVEVTKFFNWSPGRTSAVWSKQPLSSNLAAVFCRRQMEAFRSGQEGVPLDSPRPARLDDVIAFLNEETDDEKLSDLLWGLIGVEVPNEPLFPGQSEIEIPFEFGVPRLLVEDDVQITANGGHWNITRSRDANAKPDPDVFHLLGSGRTDAVGVCVNRAALRLKSGGLLVTGYRNRLLAGKPLAVVSPVRPERLLAAMLFPLSPQDLKRIANAVLYPPESEE